MKIRHYFITGFFILLPLVATIYILSFIVTSVDKLLRPVTELILGGPVYGLGFLVTIVVIFSVGVVATNVLGRKIIDFGEGFLNRIPVIRSIYGTTRQIINALILRNKTAFKKVVLFEYPRRGIYQIGFLTYKGDGEIKVKTREEIVHVFLPTTPNPTSGFLLFIPEKDIHYLDMTVEEGLKLIFSAGVFSPEQKELTPEQE